MTTSPTSTDPDLPFGRVLTAMATPFTEDLVLDLDGAQRLAAHLADHGSDGLVVCGTTGESPTLSHDETLSMLRAVVEAVGGRVPVVAGTGKNSTAASVALTKEAERIGVDGALVVTPYYNKPSQRGLARHFTEVATATDLPVLLYDVPARTARAIGRETILRLAHEVPNIVGIKDAASDLNKTSWVMAHKPDDFFVLSGEDANTLPLLAIGAVGVISVLSNVAGTDLAEMVAAFPTDPGRARRAHLRLYPLIETLMTSDTSPGPLKAALRLLGLPGGPVRPPLADADEHVEAEVAKALAAAGVKA